MVAGDNPQCGRAMTTTTTTIQQQSWELALKKAGSSRSIGKAVTTDMLERSESLRAAMGFRDVCATKSTKPKVTKAILEESKTLVRVLEEISSLDCTNETAIRELAMEHRAKGLDTTYFLDLRAAFRKYLRETIEDDYSDQVDAEWKAMFTLLHDEMKRLERLPLSELSTFFPYHFA